MNQAVLPLTMLLLPGSPFRGKSMYVIAFQVAGSVYKYKYEYEYQY